MNLVDSFTSLLDLVFCSTTNVAILRIPSFVFRQDVYYPAIVISLSWSIRKSNLPPVFSKDCLSNTNYVRLCGALSKNSYDFDYDDIAGSLSVIYSILYSAIYESVPVKPSFSNKCAPA